MDSHKPEGLFAVTERWEIFQYFQVNHFLPYYQFGKVNGFLFVSLNNSFHCTANKYTLNDSFD